MLPVLLVTVAASCLAQVSPHNDIPVYVNLQRRSLTARDIHTILAIHTRLAMIELGGSRLLLDSTQALSSANEISHLSVEGTEISSQQLAELLRTKGLQSLNAQGTSPDDSVFRAIEDSRSLKFLAVRVLESDSGQRIGTEWPTDRLLAIEKARPDLRIDGPHRRTRVPGTKSGAVAGPILLKPIVPVEKTCRVRGKLSNRIALTPEAIGELFVKNPDCDCLELIHVSLKEGTAQKIGENPRLRRITIRRSSLDHADLWHMSRIRGLIELDVVDSECPIEWFGVFSGHPSLRILVAPGQYELSQSK